MKTEVHFRIIIGLSTTTLVPYLYNGKCWMWTEDYLSLAEAEERFNREQYEWVVLDG